MVKGIGPPLPEPVFPEQESRKENAAVRIRKTTVPIRPVLCLLVFFIFFSLKNVENRGKFRLPGGSGGVKMRSGKLTPR
jgi:hypothetical protein